MINKKPYIEIDSSVKSCWQSWELIIAEIQEKILSLGKKKIIVCVECYQGTYADFNLEVLKEGLSPNVTCKARDIYKDEQEVRQLVKKDINVSFSKLSTSSIEDYFDQEKLEGLRNNIDFIEEGVILVHGIGSHKIWEPDIIIYSDISRYEILQRFRRNDISNIGVNNSDDSFDEQHRWSYFVDWRICDKLKRQLIINCDYFLETNNWGKPKLATGEIVREGLKEATKRPFFMADFFDPELWDDKTDANSNNEGDFSWGFDCDMEQNNILLKLGEYLFETPAINLIYFKPTDLLGEAVYRKFGSQMPIRFNFIDSMDSKNLTLSVFPSSDFLRDHYGISLSQNDNFYIMDAGKRSSLFLGLKSEISTEYFQDALLNNPRKINVSKLLNKVKVSKHDHIFIPPEMIHSNGESLMVLHVSVAASILEFNIYDEGKDKSKTRSSSNNRNLDILTLNENTADSYALNKVKPLENEIEQQVLAKEENQTIELQRIWFEKEIQLNTGGIIQVLNLVEGNEITIESTSGNFEPFIVHHAETFIVPGSISDFKVIPSGKGKFGLIKGSARV
ncbi:MAG: hypothetical protein JXR03_20130 [Cyclobacteriaceae bacterium]